MQCNEMSRPQRSNVMMMLMTIMMRFLIHKVASEPIRIQVADVANRSLDSKQKQKRAYRSQHPLLQDTKENKNELKKAP